MKKIDKLANFIDFINFSNIEFKEELKYNIFSIKIYNCFIKGTFRDNLFFLSYLNDEIFMSFDYDLEREFYPFIAFIKREYKFNKIDIHKFETKTKEIYKTLEFKRNS